MSEDWLSPRDVTDAPAPVAASGGDAESMLVWLWRHGDHSGHSVTVEADPNAAKKFHDLVAEFTT